MKNLILLFVVAVIAGCGSTGTGGTVELERRPDGLVYQLGSSRAYTGKLIMTTPESGDKWVSNYVNGHRHGDFLVSYSDGRQKAKALFDAGKMVFGMTWRPDGSVGSLVNKGTGTLKMYHADGSVSRESVYENGVRLSRKDFPLGTPTAKPQERIKTVSTGTGFFVTEDGFLLTNHHVVEGAQSIKVKTAEGEIQATVIAQEKSTDLALLKVEGTFKAIPLISSRTVSLGDDVITIGFPQVDVQGFSPKFTKGSISSLAGINDDPKNFQISVPIQPGNSGGPLVDKNGNVVGLVVSRLNALKLLKDKGSLPQNVNYSVKSTFALALLETNPQVLSKLKSPHKVGRSQSTIIKDVEASIALIITER